MSEMEWCKSVLVVVLIINVAKGDIGDYHSSSSAAFDEGKLESSSRFYDIGIIIEMSYYNYGNIGVTYLVLKLYNKVCSLYCRDKKVPVYKDRGI